MRWRMKFFTARRVIYLSLLFAALMVALYLYVTRANLAPVISWLASRSGYSVDIRRAYLDSDYNLRIENLSIADAARIQSIKLEWSVRSLLKFEIDDLHVDGGTFWLSRLIALSSQIEKKNSNTSDTIDASKQSQSTQPNPSTPTSKRSSFLSSVVLKEVVLSRIQLVVDNIGEGLPPVTLHMAQSPPFILLRDIHLGRGPGSLEDEPSQTATISKFTIYSPYDPLVQVILFEGIDLQFKWSELLDQKLEYIRFRQPQIFLGPDLFWYTDEVASQRAKPGTSSTPPKPWEIKGVEVTGGRLIVSVHGREAFPIPGEIAGEMTDVVVGNFSQLALKARFRTFIPELNYPEYELKVKNINASLDFNLPPTETTANNLVRTFEIDEIEWKGLKFGESTKNPAWVTLTADKTGLYSTFGTPGLKGYLNGGLAIYLDENLPWVAWGSVTSVDVAPPTKLLASEYVSLEGKVKGEVQVRGHGKEVNEFETKVDFDTPGRLEIYSVRELIEKLPEDWSQMKQELAKASLEAFEVFDYQNGLCEVAYAPPESYLKLQLKGKAENRNFHLRWKDLRPTTQSLILPVE